MKYQLLYTGMAREDLRRLSYVIREKYKSPLTAYRYLKDIEDTIKSLSDTPESFMLQHRPSLQKYGPFPRRINYKRMAIIFNVVGSVVYIQRVIPSNTIPDL